MFGPTIKSYRNNLASKRSGLWAGDLNSISTKGVNICFSYNVHTLPGAHQTSCIMGTGTPFFGMKEK
jgi:hypothetical protein